MPFRQTGTLESAALAYINLNQTSTYTSWLLKSILIRAKLKCNESYHSKLFLGLISLMAGNWAEVCVLAQLQICRQPTDL